MANYIRGRGVLRRFILGPLCVLYYYHYKNYIRTGRTENYAKFWASSSAATVLIGLYLWVGIMVERVLEFSYSGAFTDLPEEMGKIVILGVVLFVGLLTINILDRKRLIILSELSGLPLPEVTTALMIIILLGVPLMLIVAGLGKYHFLSATILMASYYSLFHFAYFDRVIRRLTSSAPA